MRPLDRLGSIKVKLGVVIVATVVGHRRGARRSATGAGLSLPVRATLAALLGLIIVQILARGMTSPLREMAAAAPRWRAASTTGACARRRATRSASWRARSTRWPPSSATPTGCGASWSPTCRTSCGRRSAALQALLENLADGVEPPDPAALRTALAQTERLGRLVAQLLDLSRLESGGAARSSGAVRRCATLLEQAARECALGDRPVRLKVCVEPGDLQTTGDPERLHQVVANLLDNAVRHSPPEGRVWLSAHAATAGRTTIVVADEGAGIPPERPSACSSASTAPTPPARRATAAPGSGSRSRAGSSTPTAA